MDFSGGSGGGRTTAVEWGASSYAGAIDTRRLPPERRSVILYYRCFPPDAGPACRAPPSHLDQALQGPLPMPRLFRWSFLLALLLAPAGTTPAADHPVVPGYERFFASGKTDLARAGRLLLSELSCLRCHAPADKATTGRPGPVLDDVARRTRPGWLRRYLADPHAVKPGTTMPDLL